jgi:hypothetical protein
MSNLEKGNVVQYRGESNGIPVSFVGMVVQISGKDVVVADINDEFNVHQFKEVELRKIEG